MRKPEQKPIADRIQDTNVEGIRRANTDNELVEQFYRDMKSIPIKEMDKLKGRAKNRLTEGLKDYIARGQETNIKQGYTVTESEFMRCLYKTLVIWQHQALTAAQTGDSSEIIQSQAMFDLIKENSMQVVLVHEALAYVQRNKDKAPKAKVSNTPSGPSGPSGPSSV